MAGFDRGWLRLRASFDTAARAAELGRRFAEALPDNPRLLDLAAGTGANLRYLSSQIGGTGQRWVLADHDPTLLDAVTEEMAGWPHPIPEIETQRIDLVHDLDSLDFGGFDGVTATALFDLVSAGWLERFGAAVALAGKPLLLTLSVDGRLRWTPDDPADKAIRHWVELHQATDKGFGPALGPAAPAALVQTLERSGFEVASADSDWVIGPADAAMHLALIDGYRGAALEMAPADASFVIEDWAARRRQAAEERRLSALVGHVDIFAQAR
jgi:hypothetical protein